jgi:hypothetical protein
MIWIAWFVRWKTFGHAASWRGCRSLRNNEGFPRSATYLVGGQYRHDLFGKMGCPKSALAIGSIERVIANHILRRPRNDRVVSGLVLAAQNTD